MSTQVVTQLEQDAVKRMYERLIASKDQSKTANESIIRDLEGSQMFQDAFCCNDPTYKEQIMLIRTTVPNNVRDDTVGEHLYGCFQSELAIEIACTPACADGGLINPDLTPCDLASYEKKGGILKKLNDISTDEAHVFIATGNELTLEDRNELRRQGIKIITIYDQDDDTINYILGETIDITQSEPIPPPNPSQEQQTNTTSWAWILLIIAIIIVVIIAAVAISRR